MRTVGPAVHVVSQNVGPTLALAPGGRIEIGFDRYLSPSVITRQTFSLRDAMSTPLNPGPAVAYDPVTRRVTVTPVATTLTTDQNYNLVIAGPNDATNALRAVDGATLDSQVTIGFAVTATGGGTQPVPAVDFCNDVFPLLTTKCGFSPCHGGMEPAAGLRLDSSEAVAATAVGRVAQGSNTGPRAAPQPPPQPPERLLFGVDMPIVDNSGGPSGGNPGNSWLLYKLLLAVPRDGGAPSPTCPPATTVTDVSTLVAQATPLPDGERAALANYVLGREMPFPGNPAADPATSTQALTVDELERVSRWIAQTPPAGGLTPPCPCQ